MKKCFKFIIFALMLIFFTGTAVEAYPVSTIESMVKIGQNAYVQPGEVVNSDVVSVGGDIYINGTVNGSAVCVGGNIYVNGTVEGDVTCIGGTISKGTQSKIQGKTTEVGKNFNIPFNVRHNYFWGLGKNNGLSKFSIASFAIMFILSFIIYEIMPKNISSMAIETKNNISKSLLYGYCSIIALAVIIVLFIVTIIGILAVPILLIAAYIVFLIGFTSIAIYCGKRLGLAVLNRNISDTWCIFIGVAVYEIIKSIRFANIGNIILILIVIPMSLGIALSTRFGTFKPWRRYAGENSEWDRFKK